MPSLVTSALRVATRQHDEPLNILTSPCHERYEQMLCKTGHRFWAYRCPQVKDWNTTFAPVPDNYVLLNPLKGDGQLPGEVDFDLVLSQNKAGQYQLLSQIANHLHVPLVSLEHTLPHPSWPQAQVDYLKSLRGHLNVFISEYSRDKWGWKEGSAHVIHHAVDPEMFSPSPAVQKKRHILSVVNQLRERDWCCGYHFWEEATGGLPRLHVGDSPDGWSRPARDISELVNYYRECGVFVDTASASPIPSVVLEAMACQCVVISRGNAMVPSIIKDGVNGFIREDPQGMREQALKVLERPEEFTEVGLRARQTVVEKFSMSKFINNWKVVFLLAAEMPYRGQP